MRQAQSSVAMAFVLVGLLLSSLCSWSQEVTVTNLHSVSDTNDFQPWPTLVADYAPYQHGQPWPSVPLVRYVEIDTNLNIWGHPTLRTKFPTMQEVHDADADFATVILRLPNGQVYK